MHIPHPHRGHGEQAAAPAQAEPSAPAHIDTSALANVFSAPRRLRDLGLLAWFLVGAGIIVVGFLARAHGRTRRAGGVRELRSRPLVLISRWRYTAIGWLMWRLWKRRLRRKVIYALLRKVGLV